MTTKLSKEQTLCNMFIERWELVAAKVADLAREYPEEKYETAPVAGVRTFAEVLRHVAFWNQYVADTARGNKADDSANELPAAKYATKARIITALTKSSDEAVAALREHDADFDAERALQAQSFIEHICEHYGQLVAYARLSGVVPPASRT